LINDKKIIFIFIAVFIATLGISLSAINHEVEVLSQKKIKHGIDDSTLNSLKRNNYFDSAILVNTKTAKEAKEMRLFWAANAEGNGVGVDILKHSKEFGELFPGYGDELRNDKEFWLEYFEHEFEPTSYLGGAQEFSNLGFMVAYSWTGCFKIYEKYGADVIVFGSSEVYKTVPPKQLAEGLKTAFSRVPKTLYCVTSAMPVEAVLKSAQELLKLSKERPSAIIWGYSFWLANTDSKKLSEYKTIKKLEFERYANKKNLNQSPTWVMRVRNTLVSGLKDYFPPINWDSIVATSFSRMRGLLIASKNTDQEGMEIAKEKLSMSDSNLDKYLNENLPPYYALSVGATHEACSMDRAKVELHAVLQQLKLLTSNIFIYVPPTSSHHRRTVPSCFFPTLDNMLKEEANISRVEFLDRDISDYSLSNRDFIHPMPSVGRYYFDINHANYNGAKKTTEVLTEWMLSHLKRR